MLDSVKRSAYKAILEEELQMATGCTEPIAIAYCAARLRDLLGAMPEQLKVEVSGNIIKNVKSVVVPNTKGQKGINVAVAAGIVAGDTGKILQVISSIPQEKQKEIALYAKNTPMEVLCMDTDRMLEIRITGYCGPNKAIVHIANNHSNIVYEQLNGTVLKSLPISDSAEDNLQDKSVLNIEDIVDYANTVPLEEVQELLQRQIRCNCAIAEEGLKNNWGANIGKTLLRYSGGDFAGEARAYAAAGSDARMSGCELPVVILSGSGNQGITASLPVVRYARHINADMGQLYRALLISDLVTIHQKTGIGRLSAYCGAVSAGCGAGAAIAYLSGADSATIGQTVVNAVAILSGMICDGAKPSCAAKIAMAVEAGIMAYEMCLNGSKFCGGDGIVGDTVESTIANVGLLARQGMRETDKTILQIMTK